MKDAIIQITFKHTKEVKYYLSRMNGYTDDIKKAHRYDLDNAKQIVESDRRITLDNIKLLVRKKKHGRSDN